MSVEAPMPDAVAASGLRERAEELLARPTEEKRRVVLTRGGVFPSSPGHRGASRPLGHQMTASMLSADPSHAERGGNAG
jgi:hypothetical protein